MTKFQQRTLYVYVFVILWYCFRYSCFELLGCPGGFWGVNPCEERVVQAAANTALKYYMGGGEAPPAPDANNLWTPHPPVLLSSCDNHLLAYNGMSTVTCKYMLELINQELLLYLFRFRSEVTILSINRVMMRRRNIVILI